NFLFGHKKTAPRRVPCEGKGNPTDAVVRSRGRRHWRAARVHLLLSKGLASFSEALKSLWKQGVGVCKGGRGEGRCVVRGRRGAGHAPGRRRARRACGNGGRGARRDAFPSRSRLKPLLQKRMVPSGSAA